MLKKSLMIGLLCCSSAFAASQAVVNQYTDSFMSSLSQKVQLTQEQKTALRPVLFNSLNAREDVIASYEGQKGMGVKRQIRDALTPINENLQSEAQNILDPQQFEAFKQVQAANQEEVKERVNSQF